MQPIRRRTTPVAALAVVGAVVAAVALAVVLLGGPGDSDDAVARPTEAVATPTPTAVAEVFRSREEACAALLAEEPTSVPDATADADREYLTDLLLDVTGSPSDVRGVGLSSCGTVSVVSVLMRRADADVPARGPGGTPVVAFMSREFVAF